MLNVCLCVSVTFLKDLVRGDDECALCLTWWFDFFAVGLFILCFGVDPNGLSYFVCLYYYCWYVLLRATHPPQMEVQKPGYCA